MSELEYLGRNLNERTQDAIVEHRKSAEKIMREFNVRNMLASGGSLLSFGENGVAKLAEAGRGRGSICFQPDGPKHRLLAHWSLRWDEYWTAYLPICKIAFLASAFMVLNQQTSG